ncbi:MAG TPA: hypothetical protein VGO93_05330 [Candidatus Xenobia bacterium]
MALVLLLLACIALRWVLVLKGGQWYHPDEFRFIFGRGVLRTLQLHQWQRFIQAALRPRHTFFNLIAAGVTAIHMGILAAQGRTAEGDFFQTLWIPALMLSLFSVGCIGMIYRVAIRAGATAVEALAAALLLGCSACFFYFSRHLLDYDASMFFLLIALELALQPGSRWRSGWTGLMCGIGFLTYMGHWAFTLVVLGMHLYRLPSARRWSHGLAMAYGFAFLPVLFTIATGAIGDEPWLLAAKGIADRGTDGDFNEGWSLPWAYLWSAEHGVLLLWVFLGAWQWRLSRRSQSPPRLQWMVPLLTIYGLLVLGSNVMHYNVVYGRIAREMVPLACLMAAQPLGHLISLGKPGGAGAILLVAVAMAAFNFRAPLSLSFPLDIRRQVEAEHGPVQRAFTIAGNAVPSPQPKSPLCLVNDDYIFACDGLQAPPAGRVLDSWPHPLTYTPYLFEGYRPETRDFLQRADLHILLIELSPTASPK